MQCDLLVGSTDSLYLRAFVDFLLLSKNNQFNITAVDNGDELLSFFSDRRFSLYLFEEAFLEEISEEFLPNHGEVLILTEAMTSIDTRRLTPVLKYQKTSAIETFLLHKLGETALMERVHGVGRGSHTVGFYSSSGGSGCTTYAQIFAMSRASKGYKTLFISQDGYQGYGLYLKDSGRGNMSDYMVHVLGGSNWISGLERYVSVDEATGLHYLAPVNHQRDLEAFGEDQWGEWLAHIQSLSDYDYVVLDLGSDLFEVVAAVLKQCTTRVFLQGEGPMGAFKWRRMVSQLEALGYDGLLEGSICLVRDKGAPFQSHEEKTDACIGYDETLLREDRYGSYQLNPYSRTYRQIEAVLAHV